LSSVLLEAGVILRAYWRNTTAHVGVSVRLASALIEEKATICEGRGAVARGYCDH
jgi:hypothetical protein